jgi:hypothetical protein
MEKKHGLAEPAVTAWQLLVVWGQRHGMDDQA